MRIPDPITVTIHKSPCPPGSAVYYNNEALDLALQKLNGNALKIWSYCVIVIQHPELDSDLDDIQQWTHLTPEEYDEAFDELVQAGYLT